MLRGEYEYALDDKGRVVIPTRFRRVLGDQVVAARGLDPCVSIYSPEGWARVEEELVQLSTGKRDIVRVILASAVDLELDRQGRVTLPARLRQYAGIDRDVVVVGLIRRVEIWNRSAWAAYIERAQKAALQIAEQVEGLRL
ncbi:MAG: division/cell wall cluster transcriptional repressor MraZ [Armatimonadota bacterium]|nr:division/cell wall cluster transcriptional repressor MraZ [Armatimonadota bacterium]MDR7455060.1 division/cell wall cluster transcriptional repressor MraZ [Armatimonadota bacterium]MDR7456896.1 division/cell wall cluster transcriptional repressor MraZ [Armatimonadota bacterium]MDR7495627.1 division/cell wall cluster transcriptional repressor MraZ [Armatimonadota bacterium]